MVTLNYRSTCDTLLSTWGIRLSHTLILIDEGTCAVAHLNLVGTLVTHSDPDSLPVLVCAPFQPAGYACTTW
jgi:ABC-type uncharacterized transport system involved in gliding motility auxiliary subunit